MKAENIEVENDFIVNQPFPKCFMHSTREAKFIRESWIKGGNLINCCDECAERARDYGLKVYSMYD